MPFSVMFVEAALKVLEVLELEWTRTAQTVIDADGEYSPSTATTPFSILGHPTAWRSAAEAMGASRSAWSVCG